MKQVELESQLRDHIAKLDGAAKFAFALKLIQEADAGLHLREMMTGLIESFTGELLRCESEDVRFWRGAALTAEQIILALEAAGADFQDVEEQKDLAVSELDTLEKSPEGDEGEGWQVDLGRADF